MDILKSFHGRRFGFGPGGELITRTNGLADIRGARSKLVSSAQVLALFATPITVLPAPPAGHVYLIRRWAVRKPAGTAYAGVAAGEDLVLKYTDASGVLAAPALETTGFLDQTTEQFRSVFNGAAQTSTPEGIVNVAAAAVVLHLLTGEITTGDSPLHIGVWYDVMETGFSALA